MKLWVDDIRNAPDDSWTIARTVTSAIRAIAHFSPEEISLDHDISHYENLDESDVEQSVYACEETFMPVAYYIGMKHLMSLCLTEIPGKGKPLWSPKVRIHSSNVTAGEEMKAVMKECFLGGIEHRPFHEK